LMDSRAAAVSLDGSSESRPRSERGLIAGGRAGNLIGPGGGDGRGDPGGGEGIALIS